MPIRIFIDQGHNPMGVNAGAEGFGLREQDINYAVGMELAKLLNSDPRFTARVSRTTPTESLGTSNSTSLQRRVYLANSWPADYFISIHCNANTNPAVNGTEVYVYQQNTQAYWLAQHVLRGVVDAVGTRDNGVRLQSQLIRTAAHFHARHFGGACLSLQRRRRFKASGRTTGVCQGNLQRHPGILRFFPKRIAHLSKNGPPAWCMPGPFFFILRR